MVQPSRSPQTALIVHAHPERDSFATAQMRVAEAALRSRGYDVTTLDLYAEGWAPTLDRAEFGAFQGPFKPQREQARAFADGTLAEDVRADLDALLAADLLVLSFPLWWFSLPAVLKGWVDRVFVMGAVFGGELGLFDGAALAGRRAMLLLTTGGPAEAFAPGGAFGDLDAFLFHVHRGMLEFVGYRVLEPVVTFGPAHLDDARRSDALGAVRDAFEAIELRDGHRRATPVA
jgi:NAD(P)H dehydrogenase (quinone)